MRSLSIYNISSHDSMSEIGSYVWNKFTITVIKRIYWCKKHRMKRKSKSLHLNVIDTK